MMNELIEIKVGDLVSVNFNNAQYTLCSCGRVESKPAGTGDSWVIYDEDGRTHYISEGCTITKIET